MSEHRHSGIVVASRTFTGCVAPTNCNPAAHGWMVNEEVCLKCGMVRRVAFNQQYREAGRWEDKEDAAWYREGLAM